MNAHKIVGTLNDRCKLIFNIIQKYGPITKSEILNKTQMKLTTLNRDMSILTSKKIIVENATAESTGGRKPVLYDVNPQDFYIIGIDISRTYTKIVITNLKFEVIEEKIIIDSYSVSQAIENLQLNINDLMKKLGIDNNKLVGIGIGIFMGLDINVLSYKLTMEYEVPIFIDNGANAAVTGEYFCGLGKDKQNIAYIHCGVGIRTGVISSGTLIRSINNSEDALGHMIINSKGDRCECGNRGCVETYVSINKITSKFSEKLGEVDKAALYGNLNEINYIDICRLAEDGHKAARGILMDSALYFGIGLANFIRLLNPQLIILSGPLIQHSQLFYYECKRIALEKCHVIDNSVNFNKGGYFKSSSIAVGASVMVMGEIMKVQN